jgi:hypothetical protein
MPHRLARLSSPRGRGRQAPRARPSRASFAAPMASGPGALESSRHATSTAWRTPRRFPWRSEPGSQRPRGHDLRRDVRPAATQGPFAVRLHRPCVPGPVTTAVAGYDLCDATWTSRRGAEGLQRAARALLGAPIAVGGDDRLELDRGLDLGDHVPGDHQRQGPALFRCRGDQRIPGTRTSSSSGTRVIAAVSSVTGDRSTWLRPPAWSMLR